MFRMSKDTILAIADLLKEAAMKLVGKRPESEDNQTDFRTSLDSVDEHFDIPYRAKRQRKEHKHLAVRPMVGKANLEYLETILSWIKEDKVDQIGVFGMGGCGKTTLAMHVYNRLVESDYCPILGWVSVGMDFNIARLQLLISDAIGLDLEYEKDENRRAARLYNFLSTRGRFLLILDDVWEPYPLQKLGIPMLGSCKVIITTRMLSVCKQSGCQKMIHIGMLEADEAWGLFCSKLGLDSLATTEVIHIAKLVCHECRGLPLAMTTLATSLSGVNDLTEWRFALQELQGFSTRQDLLMSNHLFQKLLLSYNRLINTKVKHCFLYSALYPEDFVVPREELIRLWLAMGLMDDVPSLRMQYDKGHTIVNNLVDHCLLESSKDRYFVKMHDIIRKMAFKISEHRSLKFLARPGAQLKELFDVPKFMEDIHAVSLARNSISEIPSGVSPNCTRLSILLLQHNPLEGLPDSFFVHMPSLLVLDLSYTSIVRLPESVCNLKNLRSLLLHSCKKLAYVPSLANLKALQILDLGHSAIQQVPSGLKVLSMLRELDLSGFSKLKELGQGILSMLPSLKRISCYVVGVLQELQSLRSLEFLDATFHNISDFNSYVVSQHWRVLDGFHLQVGVTVLSNKVVSHYNYVVALHGCSIAYERGQHLVLPDNLSELYIDKCKGLGNLVCTQTSFDGPDVKDRSIYKGVCLVDFRKCGYPSLEAPVDLNQPDAAATEHHRDEEIYHFDRAIQGSGVFSNLETWTISRCHDLERLLTPRQLMDFPNLQVMKIRDCKELKELITEEVGDRYQSENGDHVISLPNLKMFELTNLPMLSNIYRGLLLCTSLQSIQVVDCPKLTQLPFSFFLDDQHKVLLPTLEQIEGQGEWWESLKLDQIEAKALLASVFRQKSSARCVLESGMIWDETSSQQSKRL